MAATKLIEQIEGLRENKDVKDKTGILIRPKRLIKGIQRADRVVDDLCDEALQVETNSLQRAHLKNSYAVKGYGFGRGTQFSHPRMDYMCLSKAQTAKLKQRCEMYRTEGKNIDSNYEYYKSEQFNMHGQTIKSMLQSDGATNAVFANLEI